MVKSRSRSKATAKPVGRRIGFVGRNTITEDEGDILRNIGRYIARFGHTLVIAPTIGSVNAVREGVVSEGGRIEEVTAGVLDASDHSLLYPDPQLLQRMRERYPDIETNPRYSIITPDNLVEWYDAISTVAREKGIATI